MTPTKQQLEFLGWEMGAFFHFGIQTFYEGHRDWKTNGREHVSRAAAAPGDSQRTTITQTKEYAA